MDNMICLLRELINMVYLNLVVLCSRIVQIQVRICQAEGKHVGLERDERHVLIKDLDNLLSNRPSDCTCRMSNL